ncbi:hypothetical protein L7F22_053711 [Adiantum nelumboides]|nr:hypothetical protein [Adiantum nelumboides]MCO5599605.1 hypothetical protein [Adiantum nelumboides]
MLFAKDYTDVSGVNAIQHKIQLKPEAKPKAQKLQRLGVIKEQALLKEIKKLLAVGFIYPVENFEWVSPVVATPKKNGKWRVCVNYRPLNVATKRDHFPLPFQDEILNEVAGHEKYTACDGYFSYFQIGIASEYQLKTTFITPCGCYAFRVMPFGLTNAPATFQRFMNIVFQAFFGKSIRVFIDDFCIYSSRALHAQKFEEGLRKIYDLGGQLNSDKCHIGEDELILLGHKISYKSIEVDPSKGTALIDLPSPKSIKEVISFVQKVKYMSRFIHLASELLHPLQRLTQQVEFAWSKELEEYFCSIKVNGNKRLLHVPRQLVFANDPFEKWGIDAMGPLPRNKNGKLYILVAIDYMTRWVEAQSVARVNEKTVSRKGLLIEFWEELHIVHQHGTPYYPQSNGLVEKANGTIAGIISKMVKDKTKLWDDFLDGALWAYWTTYKEATEFTSFHLVYGQEALQPIELNIPTMWLHGKIAQGEEAWTDRLLTLAELEWKRKVAYECYKRKATQGPYIVKEAFNSSYYQLMDLYGNEHPRKVNGYRLKPYLSRILPMDLQDQCQKATLSHTGASTEQVKLVKDWHQQGSAKVMYWLFVSVSDSIVDADSPKDAWDNLIAFNATTNTRTRKLQLKNELNTIKKGDLSVNDYTLKIKALCESLSSIGVAVDDDDKVEACLRGLGNAYKQFKTSIRTRENIRHFLELSSCWLLRKRASLMMELFKQKEIAPNMPFGQVQEEVEGVMHKEVAVAIKVNANNNSKTNKPSKISMVNKGLCVVEDSSEVGGVLVKVVVIKETMQKMITG